MFEPNERTDMEAAMNLVGRAQKPWDALFIFHFFSMERDQFVGEMLQKLVTREASTGLKPFTLVKADEKSSRCSLLDDFWIRRLRLPLYLLGTPQMAKWH
ncbi:hypothetical protein FQV27_09030 [Paracoccus aurantiacus]|uniref:Uncharacterized protein n=1 Tax=Paracoccus aurantiacus TaxID=2599412 RepID=A0A5C6S653_9RHOB|nr:hypothetical protein [Paracoccus aurantiacus]TXB69104.1 hypothetical protein FQV27_09030 [Paracoccus aurantiacus]